MHCLGSTSNFNTKAKQLLLSESMESFRDHKMKIILLNYFCSPLLRLTTTLLSMGVFSDDDVKRLLVLLEPGFFAPHLQDLQNIKRMYW